MSWFGPRYPERRRVAVALVDDSSVEGVLWSAGSDFLVLKGAKALRERGAAMPMDGDVVIYRERIQWIQVLSDG